MRKTRPSKALYELYDGARNMKQAKSMSSDIKGIIVKDKSIGAGFKYAIYARK